MRDKLSFPELREQAIALRRAGKSRREIKDILGIGSNETLDKALQGEPPPEWTRRPRAKDERHVTARELRAQGRTYNEIAAELGVSKSSVSLWVRDLPRTGRLSYEESRRRIAEGVSAYWAAQRPIREARWQANINAAAAQIGRPNDRELLIAGAIAYWCEGAKNKPYRRPANRVIFINSDPSMISFFLRFLTVAGIERDRLICRVHIHESADVDAAQRFWLDTTAVPADQFRRPILKRHNPKTVRKNTGEDYHGCLIVTVRRSMQLYQQIEGWAAAVMAARS
jgi:DNA-binding CsgD family transcriptional regulator